MKAYGKPEPRKSFKALVTERELLLLQAAQGSVQPICWPLPWAHSLQEQLGQVLAAVLGRGSFSAWALG